MSIRSLVPLACSSRTEMLLQEGLEQLDLVSREAESSSEKVERKINSRKSKLTLKINKMPKWAKHHIQIYTRFRKVLSEVQSLGGGSEIPSGITEIFERSSKALCALGEKVNHVAFLKLLRPPESLPYADSTRMATLSDVGENPSHRNVHDWELNYALLCSAYEKTDDKSVKESIRFLIMNYLSKAAFLNAGQSYGYINDQEAELFKDMLQLGQITMGGSYHRTTDKGQSFCGILGIEKKIGARRDNPTNILVMERVDVQDLFKVGFIVAPDLSRPDEIVALLVKQFEANIDKFPEENFPFPILLDITDQIGQSLITGGEESKIAEYERRQGLARVQILDAWQRAAEQIKAKYTSRKDIQEKVADYLKVNTAVVSRAQFNEDLAVCGMHFNMFEEGDFDGIDHESFTSAQSDREGYICGKLKEWAGWAAVSVGAVSFRRAIASLAAKPEDLVGFGAVQSVKYSVVGRSDVIQFPNPKDLISTSVFDSFKSLGDGQIEGASEAEQLLAKTTSRMIVTLLKQIPEASWLEKQEDLAIRELTQTAVFKIMQDMATAIHKKDSFREFSQAIDRVHAQLTTLLEIYSPFDTETFEGRYGSYLEPIVPASITPKIGLGRSAMNVFSGINEVLISEKPNLVRTCDPDSYYEEVDVVGGAKTLNEVLADEDVLEVDLFMTEFYHNINVDVDHVHYGKSDVVGDIKRIFREKPRTEKLTVALDTTIDFVDSKDLQRLLHECEEEIQSGRLNIVAFRSGQKFDMLGFDNYFGGPFVVINNGDSRWDGFKKLTTDGNFQTDKLSQQYFTWMASTGVDTTDAYKRMIFENTKAVLEMVPESLRPENNTDVCVSAVDDDVISPFIDIKVDLPGEWDTTDLHTWIYQRFMQIFLHEKKLVYRRGSFGFAHPNITLIEPKMRINPGLDAAEGKLYKQFFLDLEQKVAEMKAERTLSLPDTLEKEVVLPKTTLRDASIDAGVLSLHGEDDLDFSGV